MPRRRSPVAPGQRTFSGHLAGPIHKWTLQEIENLMDPSRPTVYEQCGSCLADHHYRLIADDPEDWEQLEDCGA